MKWKNDSYNAYTKTGSKQYVYIKDDVAIKASLLQLIKILFQFFMYLIRQDSMRLPWSVKKPAAHDLL